MSGRLSTREGEYTLRLLGIIFKLIYFSPLGGRHAAVIPALPEEFDSSIPLGGYYPSEREREREREETPTSTTTTTNVKTVSMPAPPPPKAPRNRRGGGRI